MTNEQNQPSGTAATPAGSPGSLKPLYLIMSEQPFLQMQAVRRLRARFEKYPDFDFNFDQFDGPTASGAAIVGSANTLPFGPPYRLVLVMNADALSAEATDAIVAYAESPSPTTVLAVVGAKIKKNSKLYKRFAANGEVLERVAPSKRDLPRAVVSMCRDRGLRCPEDVAEAIISLVGEDLEAIDTAIKKVKSFVGDRDQVTRNDIAEVVGASAEVKVWELASAIGSRKGGEALLFLDRMLEQGNTVYAAQALAVRTVRDLMTARSLIDRGEGTASRLAVELGRQEWLARRTLDQAYRFEAEELREALRSMAEVEYQMKTSRDPRLAFERWVLTVCGR